AAFINCTLKRAPNHSHTQGLADISIEIMRRQGVTVDAIRAVDHDIATGVWPDMTEHGWERDEWPELYERVEAAHILVLCTPIWLGEKSSICTQVIERLYGNSHLLNDRGQYAYYGRIGGCLVTGNEDGVKHCSMNILYSLQHLGYVIPPQADAGWIGEARTGAVRSSPWCRRCSSRRSTTRRERFELFPRDEVEEVAMDSLGVLRRGAPDGSSAGVGQSHHHAPSVVGAFLSGDQTASFHPDDVMGQ